MGAVALGAAAVGAAAVLMAALCTGCGSGGRSASATVAGYVAAWNRGDGTALSAFVDRPPAGLGATLAAITAGLHASSATRIAGPVTTHGSTGQAPLTSTYVLPGVGPWKVSTVIDLVHRSGGWNVEWSPAEVAPGLLGGQKLVLAYEWAPRASILGAGGASLTAQQSVVEVGVEGSRIKDPAALSKVLLASGATSAQVSSALAAASTHPDFFEAVFDLSADQYAKLGGNTSSLYSTPGTVFRHTATRSAVTPGLASHLVGTVGPITADELSRLDGRNSGPYTASSSVGQGGLEGYFEKQLAGTPGGTVEVVDGSGRTVSTLATFTPVPGQAVQTSIDPVVQGAAEQALSTVTSAANTLAMVAMRVSTGQLLAAVSLPAANPFDAVLAGEFPPGSTFKVLTTTALLQAGLTPASPASCPPTATIDGEVFHNAEGDHPVPDLAAAFTESCNTAFVQLATAHLSPSSFTSVASLYGLDQPVQMGYPGVTAHVPAPKDGAGVAATAIGQAGVVFSPLGMASVAADVARGSVLPARLVAGAPADSAHPSPVPSAVVASLHSMMAAVVASGTAAGVGLPAGTYAKTGTAQYGSGNPLPTDAWLMGWHGDVAFAVVYQNSPGNGGPVDGPIVARFLKGLPPAYG